MSRWRWGCWGGGEWFGNGAVPVPQCCIAGVKPRHLHSGLVGQLGRGPEGKKLQFKFELNSGPAMDGTASHQSHQRLLVCQAGLSCA